MTANHAFTVWCAGGRIGTYRTRDKAEAKLKQIAEQPERFLHIQEWQPGVHYDYVTFDDEADEQTNS